MKLVLLDDLLFVDRHDSRASARVYAGREAERFVF